MRAVVAVFLLAHGVAHVVGFAVNWKLIESAEVPYRTTLAGLDIGDGGTRAVGLVWIALAASFVVAAAGAVTAATWWLRIAQVAVAISLPLCLAAWPASRLGVPANLIAAALITAIALGHR